MVDDFQGIRIEVSDGGGVLKGAYAQRYRDLLDEEMEKVMEAAGKAVLKAGLRDQFAKEGGTLGDPWADVNPDYADWKLRVFGSEKIGTRSGAMSEAAIGITSVSKAWQGIRGGPVHVATGTATLEATSKSVIVGVDAEEDGEPYARHFDDIRPIFGTGKLPTWLEESIGGSMYLAHAAIARGVGAKVDMAVDRYLEGAGPGVLGG